MAKPRSRWLSFRIHKTGNMTHGDGAMGEDSRIDALEYSRGILRGIEKKARENKRETTVLFLVVTVATAFSPVLILLPLDFVLSKTLPAILTSLAALATSWLQIRKPQDRWVMYRTAQREIEFQIDQYLFGNGEYASIENKDALLADRVSNRALQLHYEWLPVAPRLDELEKARRGSVGGSR